MKNMNKKGFTVVELVVVIAVIAILLVFVIPSAATMFHKARLSNDRQEARNTYSYYLQLINYKDGDQPVKDGAVRLKDGTLVKLEDGIVYADEKVEEADVDWVVNTDGSADCLNAAN